MNRKILRRLFLACGLLVTSCAIVARPSSVPQLTPEQQEIHDAVKEYDGTPAALARWKRTLKKYPDTPVAPETIKELASRAGKVGTVDALEALQNDRGYFNSQDAQQIVAGLVDGVIMRPRTVEDAATNDRLNANLFPDMLHLGLNLRQNNNGGYEAAANLMYNKIDVGLEAMLGGNGIDPNVKDQWTHGNLAHALAGYSDEEVENATRRRLADTLYRKGTDFSARDNHGMTPADVARGGENDDFADYLDGLAARSGVGEVAANYSGIIAQITPPQGIAKPFNIAISLMQFGCRDSKATNHSCHYEPRPDGSFIVQRGEDYRIVIDPTGIYAKLLYVNGKAVPEPVVAAAVLDLDRLAARHHLPRPVAMASVRPETPEGATGKRALTAPHM